MKTKIFILLFAIMASMVDVSAKIIEGVLIGDLYYNLNTSTQTAEVTYKSRSSDGLYYNLSWGIAYASIPEKVTYNNSTYSVTSIGNCAFRDCSNLTSVTIPNSVTSIGWGVFQNCISLPSVTISNSVTSIELEYTFYGCSSLTSVTIPNCVTSIGDATFMNCSNLTSVTIPNNVTSIGNCAFQNCSGLTSVTIPNKVNSIGNYAFYGCNSLTVVCSESAAPATLGPYDTFTATSTIYVPQCAYTAYHNAPSWKDLTIVPVQINLSVANNVGGVAVETCGSMEVEAIPFEGYHFKKWLDGNTDNPRRYSLSQTNLNFIAQFEINKYTITLNCDASQGSITGDKGKYNYDTDHTIEAVPNYGYHFTQWSDGETENPREFTLEQDTTFTALFAPNKYNLTIQYDNTYGDVVGEQGTFDYLSEHSIRVNAKYGYHFTSWSDGVTDNPRTLVLTQDTTITASFAPNKYRFEAFADATMGTVTGEQGEFDYLTDHTIEAVPNYGYHFTQWSDGETDNPREFTLVQDTTFTALFAPNKYKLTIQYDNTYGEVVGDQGTFDYLSEHSIQVNAKYGYHFTSWSDGVTYNPRTLVLTQDTTITASFAPNKYRFEAFADATMGAITGEQGEFDYLTEHTVEAVQNTGYLFTGWSDGVTDNPRTIVLTKDTSITALFEQNLYNITVLCNEEQGSVEATGEFYEGGTCTIIATPKYGYHFTQWSDGNTDNPRTIIVTKDETFTAEFAIDKSGTCGDNLALTWTYDSDMKELTISGDGTLNSDYTFGVEAPTSVEKLTIVEGVTAIGNSAFANYTTINEIVFATSVKTIYEQAFYNCANLMSIYCYRDRPCVVYSNTFDGVDKFDCTLYVPATSIEMYKAATGWRDFYFIEAISGTTTAIDSTSSERQTTRKVIRNGQLFILRDGKTYTVQGQEVR